MPPMSPALQRLLGKMDPGAEQTLRGLIEGAVRTQAIHVAAVLGIADQLALGPLPAEVLAARAGAHAPTLRRILRLLVTHGVFIEHEDGRFDLNAAAEYLQSAHPGSLRPSALHAGSGLWELGGLLLDAARSGRTPQEAVHGAPFFEHLEATGRHRGFGHRMTRSAVDLGEALAGLPWIASARTVMDVGGGGGALLVETLRPHAHLRGIILDRPEMITRARATIAEAGLGDRCEAREGDFFDALPPGADLHVLSWILHDWDDERAGRILGRCREAGARTLVLVEVLLPARATHVPQQERPAVDPFALDLLMLLQTGGRERTLEEYRDLLGKHGFDLDPTVTPAPARGASILRAVARDQE